ncbi:hypothetical protein ACFSHQ_05325 [Gemmobacter lanyuensis]
MKKILIPLILTVVGAGGGAGAGLYLRPVPTEAETPKPRITNAPLPWNPARKPNMRECRASSSFQ